MGHYVASQYYSRGVDNAKFELLDLEKDLVHFDMAYQLSVLATGDPIPREEKQLKSGIENRVKRDKKSSAYHLDGKKISQVTTWSLIMAMLHLRKQVANMV